MVDAVMISSQPYVVIVKEAPGNRGLFFRSRVEQEGDNGGEDFSEAGH